MPGAVELYMVQSLVNGIYCTYRYLHCHELRAETVICGRLEQFRGIASCKSLVCPRVGIYHHFVTRQWRAYGRKVLQSVGMHYQAVEGIAYAAPSGLAILYDTGRHCDVGILVEIGIHHSRTSLYDRHLGGVADEINELSATTWYAHVNKSHGVEHLCRSLVGGRKECGNGGVHAVFLKHGMNEAYRGTARAVGILSTFQYSGIAALQAEREHVEGDVGACLVDDADNAKGYAYALQPQAVVQRLVLCLHAKGRG